MAYETLVVETGDHIGEIRLDRPDAMNALNAELLRELAAAIGEHERGFDHAGGSDDEGAMDGRVAH